MFKKKWFRNLVIVVGALVLIWVLCFVANLLANRSLRKYIDSFEPVKYDAQRVVPVKEDGYMTITTDEDLRIMHLTDIHIGGGFLSYKNDKKTIYEVITMLQKEAPDIVVLGGDNTYCLPKPGFNGGNNGNNIDVTKTFIHIFEHEEVYYTTVFGNHDSESVAYASRDKIGELYMSSDNKYCFFEQNFSDRDAETVPSVTNQIVVVKNADGKIRKLLLLIDSNAYEDTSFLATVFGKYDVIHDAQIEWAKGAVKDLSEKEGLEDGEYLKALCFMHIPFGEYKVALDELFTEVTDEKGNIIAYVQNENHNDTEFIGGVWDEKICYGGSKQKDQSSIKDLDNFFEEMCLNNNIVEAVLCGHDHVNNGVVRYKGVYLGYGFSVDNEAYGNKIMESGQQRGATVVTLSPDGTFTEQHKNAYLDYGCETDKFTEVYLDHPLYEDSLRTIE